MPFFPVLGYWVHTYTRMFLPNCYATSMAKTRSPKYKTRLCRNNPCPYGPDCIYAHGKHELRSQGEHELRSHGKHELRSCNKAYIEYSFRYQMPKQRIICLEALIHDVKSAPPDTSYQVGCGVHNSPLISNGHIANFHDDDKWSLLATHYSETVKSEDHEKVLQERIPYGIKNTFVHVVEQQPVLPRTESCPVLGLTE